MRTRFVVLVPVKALDLGKSRLVGIDEADRRTLAEAFALDTVAAARATPGVAEVAVVTNDPHMSEQARLAGCSVLPDTGDLNESLRRAAASLEEREPRAVAVALCADLPALDVDDLRCALDQIDDATPWFVSDHLGTGTTMYAAPPGRFTPEFGAGSSAAHGRAGAREITADVPRLRRDVDTLDDLSHLASLGVLGAHTTRALAAATVL